jgi:hypothetical protein
VKIYQKILSALLLTCVVNAKAKAQSFQNKKATGVQTFTLRLTRPAATQVDMTQTANQYLNQDKNVTVGATVGDKNNSFTVTDVSTESADTSVATTTGAAPQPADKIQVITLSKA